MMRWERRCWKRFAATPARPCRPSSRPPLAFDLLLPVHIRKDGIDLRFFSTIMTLGTPQDVTLQELRIETFFPADDSSEAVMRKITAS